jgi:TonB family protein
MRSFLAQPSGPTKKMVQEITVLRPPPPPPPEEQPPPPEQPEEEVDVPEPEPEPAPTDAPPAGEQLGLDAEGGAGSDGFGLAARPGGRELLGTGGSTLTWYSGLVQNAVLGELQGERDARGGSYSVRVQLWVRADGSVERARLVQSSGNPERDRAIERALARVARIAQPPPREMPQPINLRIVSRA